MILFHKIFRRGDNHMIMSQRIISLILLTVCLSSVAIAQPSFEITSSAYAGSANNFAMTVANTGNAQAALLPVVYYWSGTSWVLAPIHSAMSSDFKKPMTDLGGGYSYVLADPGNSYSFTTDAVIPSGEQWIAWNAYWWDGTKWVLVDPTWGNVHKYTISAGSSGPSMTTPSSSSTNPWDDPTVRQLIDEWIRQQDKCLKSVYGSGAYIDQWGRACGTLGSTQINCNQPPDHPADWDSYHYLWANNWCPDYYPYKVQTYVESRKGGTSFDSLAKCKGKGELCTG